MLVALIGDWRSLAVRGAAAVLFGFLALIWPDLTLWALVGLWGAYVLVDGISILVVVLRGDPGAEVHRPLHIFEGIVSIVAGLLTFIWPHITALVLLYLIAAWALITGALEVAAAIRLRRLIANEWMLGLVGAVSVLLAIALVVTPGTGALAITWAIGWSALISGALYLSLAWRLKRSEVEVGGTRQSAFTGGRF
ncbi:MAG TPA: HdeD family acid-resistance protein [Acidimicrobiales bacterium]|jgi:uncharacterized membrane protein HdeD (DUF308 family)|nr:HdeD family acid-resistance protein [Acidimicrobiales bacterium]